jgi:hypothetical protein
MANVFNKNADWEESVGLKTTAPMRERMRDLATTDNSDDYDKAVLMLLEDFARLKVLLAVQTDANQRT